MSDESVDIKPHTVDERPLGRVLTMEEKQALYDMTNPDKERDAAIDEFVRRVEALIASSTNEQGAYGFITATQLRAVAKEMKDGE